MISKEQRLDRGVFMEVLKRGRKVHTATYSLYYMPAPTFRAAVVVSKKIARRAVVRNHIRRRTYTALRSLEISQGYFLVLMKAPGIECSFFELVQSLEVATAQIVGFRGHSR